MIRLIALAVILAAPSAHAASKRSDTEKRLTLDDVKGILDAPTGLRDAPAALPSPAANPAVWRAPAGGPMRAPLMGPIPSATRAPWTSQACLSLARSLRSGKPAPAGRAHEYLVLSLRSAQKAMKAREIPKNSRISLLTTNAETEIAAALFHLESPSVTDASYRDALAAVSRAASDLEQAGRRLEPR